MQNHERDFEQGDLAEIWRSAQHRRTEDVGGWLADYFRRRRLESSDDRLRYPDAPVHAPQIKST
jgi:hypothetical protein